MMVMFKRAIVLINRVALIVLGSGVIGMNAEIVVTTYKPRVEHMKLHNPTNMVANFVKSTTLSYLMETLNLVIVLSSGVRLIVKETGETGYIVQLNVYILMILFQLLNESILFIYPLNMEDPNVLIHIDQLRIVTVR
jgi:hypothetical protein